MRKEPAVDRFWRKVLKTDTCWLWTAAKDGGGYGMFNPRDNHSIHASRFSWILHNGPIEPAILDVLHTCDNPVCVNPAHLFLGTEKDNMQDMARKGRHGNAKLTPELVRAIRARAAEGEVKAAIARTIGVSSTLVYRVVNGTSWTHVL